MSGWRRAYPAAGPKLTFVWLRVLRNIPTTKDVEPLLEIDGDVRAFEVFLSSRTPVLTARDIRTFLPCTVNLDPKLREIIAGTLAPHPPTPRPLFSTSSAFFLLILSCGQMFVRRVSR